MAGPRTALAVDSGVERIVGQRCAWRFRPHFHAGDEVVRLTAGRALLRTAAGCREVSASETVVVPAGTVHRFEPLDSDGWAFTSEFVRRGDTAGPGHRLVARAIELLCDREGLRSDPSALARACGVSAGHLARTFRRIVGSGLHNFQVVLVLQKAKALLRDSVPIAGAAIDSGFYDQAHMTREFVRTYGFTPKAFQTAWLAGRPDGR
jgi:AraC-like DNA-binding protein